MLGRRRRRWFNIQPTLGQCIVLTGLLRGLHHHPENMTHSPNVELMLGQRRRRWVIIRPHWVKALLPRYGASVRQTSATSRNNKSAFGDYLRSHKEWSSVFICISTTDDFCGETQSFSATPVRRQYDGGMVCLIPATPVRCVWFIFRA